MWRKCWDIFLPKLLWGIENDRNTRQFLRFNYYRHNISNFGFYSIIVYFLSNILLYFRVPAEIGLQVRKVTYSEHSINSIWNVMMRISKYTKCTMPRNFSEAHSLSNNQEFKIALRLYYISLCLFMFLMFLLIYQIIWSNVYEISVLCTFTCLIIPFLNKVANILEFVCLKCFTYPT